jgi:predicted RNA-binding protein with EMAP domain
MIFDDKFKLDKQLQMLWLAFLERTKLDSNDTFQDVVTKVQSFIEPIFDEKTEEKWNPNKWIWE